MLERRRRFPPAWGAPRWTNPEGRPRHWSPAVGGSPLDIGCLALLLALGAALAATPPTPIALGLLGIALMSTVASPPAALATVLASLPLAFRPIAIADASLSLLEVAITLFVLGVAVHIAGAMTMPAGRSRVRRLVRPVATSAPALALLLAAILSLFTLADPDYRRESLREYRLVIVEPLLFFVAARWVLRDVAARRLVVAAFVAAGMVVALVALVQVASGTGGVAADGTFRGRASYPHPNNLAFYLERVAVFAGGCAIATWRRGSAPPILTAAVCVLLLAGGGATLSRGLLLAVVAGFGVVVTLVGSRRAWLAYGGAVAAALGGFALLAGGRLFDIGGAGQEPTRLLIWRASLRMARDHPVFGVGLDQFLPIYGRRYVEPAGWAERFTSHPHNLALDLWLRLGILGMLAFAWLTAAVGRLAAGRRLVPTGATRGPAVGAIGALTAGLVHGLVDNGFFLPDLALMTWFFVALVETAATEDPAIEAWPGPTRDR